MAPSALRESINTHDAYASRMRRDGDNSDLAHIWTVAREDAVGAGRAVLNVSLEDFRVRIVRILDRVVFVLAPQVRRARRASVLKLPGEFRRRFQIRRGLCDVALACLVKSTPHRCQGLRVLVEPRFALRNHASESNDDLVVATVFDDNSTVRKVASE